MEQKIKEISLDLIDDPLAPVRSVMDEVKLQELADSIKSVGLIQPVTLQRKGKRFEVVAGHRRLKASKIAGLASIKALVVNLGEEEADDLKIHENLFREDLNPVDEGRNIAYLIQKYEYTPEQMAKKIGKKVGYVLARYDLLSYPDYLVGAVEKSKIGLTAAGWLARITDDRILRDYVRFAILGGITAKRAEAWFRSWSAGNLPREPETFVASEVQGDARESVIEEICAICHYRENIDNMAMHYVHTDCLEATKRAALADEKSKVEKQPRE